MGSFHTPPVRLLQVWEWYGSPIGDCPPANYLAVKGFDRSGVKVGRNRQRPALMCSKDPKNLYTGYWNSFYIRNRMVLSRYLIFGYLDPWGRGHARNRPLEEGLPLQAIPCSLRTVAGVDAELGAISGLKHARMRPSKS